jgi:hypothetical protein
VLLKSDLDVQQTHLLPLEAESGLLNKSSRLAPALGATKLIPIIAMSHFVVLLKSDLDIQQTPPLLNI